MQWGVVTLPIDKNFPTKTRRASKGKPLGASGLQDGEPHVVVSADGLGRDPESRVYETILKALLGGTLKPGTALRERLVAESFGVTRGAVRKALLRLGAEGKLQLRPNRGAFVPDPSPDDVRTVYEARKALESGIVALLAKRIEPEQLAALDALVHLEQQARQEGRRDDSVRLAGNFHRTLAAFLGNSELAVLLHGMVARTQLFVSLFESPDAGVCTLDEHDDIVDALRRRDAHAAMQAMVNHLGCVERRVLQRSVRRERPDLKAILRTAAGLRGGEHEAAAD